MNVEDFKQFIDFNYAMLKIIEEKEKKYKEQWKTDDVYLLADKLQLTNELLYTIASFNGIEKERSKRLLLHLANYCFFLYTRLGDE